MGETAAPAIVELARERGTEPDEEPETAPTAPRHPDEAAWGKKEDKGKEA